MIREAEPAHSREADIRPIVLLFILLLVTSCAESKSSPPASQSGAALYSPDGFDSMPAPQPGEWLDQFDEPGQTFEQYVASDPVRPIEDRSVLTFLPCGPFSRKEREIVLAAVEFAGLWFELPVRVLPDHELPRDRWQRTSTYRPGSREFTQYRTDWFLDWLLPSKRPDDAVCLTAVTMGDLYPSADWNFVFGMGSFKRRVAVYSLARFYESFYGREDTAESRRQALRRAAGLVTHELGHCFGLHHCIYYRCNMNGSNSLGESDRQPLRLCPVCLRKLEWNRGFDPIRRYRGLLDFYEVHGLTEEAAWVRNRLIFLGALGS